MIFLEIFLTLFGIGLLAFGGGYVVVPLLQSEALARGWFEHISEFAELVGLAQITPGPLGINIAAYVGHGVAGPFGAIAAVAGLIAPSFVLILLVCLFLRKFYEHKLVQGALSGIRPVTVGLIATAGFSFILMSLPLGGLSDTRGIVAFAIIFAAAFGLSFVKKLNPIWIILLCALLGILLW